ncbi:MAG: MBL fold metallo-hydrolase [Methanomicrobiaceae archaeon]|nr:MBL fold metallo-hydrolase [Methanomicrobiaceae archaeon]
MKVTVLASGSKGNCTYIEGDSGALLIDAGLSAKELLRRVEEAGGTRELIKGIVLTHEHSDHMKGVDVLARKLNIPVYATHGTLWQFEEKRRTDRSVTLKPCRKEEAFKIGEFGITAFSTYHDACDPCGFLISENGSKVAYCTDTGKISEKMTEYLKKADHLILESNHCPDMLENGPYPVFLKERIRDRNRGHLSNNAASECLRTLKNEIASVLLAHLSEENNTPKKALDNASGVLCSGCSVSVGIALQHEISPTNTI